MCAKIGCGEADMQWVLMAQQIQTLSRNYTLWPKHNEDLIPWQVAATTSSESLTDHSVDESSTDHSAVPSKTKRQNAENGCAF